MDFLIASEDVHALPASQSSGISEVSAGPVIGESQTNETELPTKWLQTFATRGVVESEITFDPLFSDDQLDM